MNQNPYKNPLKFDVNSGRIVERRTGFRYRYPRLFVGLLSSTAILIFFSKPLYDIFLSEQTFDLEQLRREHKPRFSK